MISSAVLVQLNGWQSVFQLSMNLVIAPMRSVTELNAPRRIACRVMMPKKISSGSPSALLRRGPLRFSWAWRSAHGWMKLFVLSADVACSWCRRVRPSD